jgi:hypothetical protein
MEHRRQARLAGVSEISLLSSESQLITRASIVNLSEGGILVGYVDADVLAAMAPQQQMRFEFSIPSGKVEGSAEVTRVVAAESEVALRLVSIDNQGGLANLLTFLHSWLCGVD